MELDPEIYDRLKSIDWFAQCGRGLTDELGFSVEPAPSLSEALIHIRSDRWQDARTEAQGDLTAYLSKHHINLYGGHWNRLARESRQRILTEIMPAVTEALAKCTVEPISDIVLLDLNRIALRASYRKRCPKVPSFFDRLSAIYAAGRLPCGWTGNLESWPDGMFVVY
ncbi:hypothetical protein GC170_08510 [bacterium]|nr:hypothetical protein [bacterium]